MFVIKCNLMESQEQTKTFPAAVRVSEEVIKTIRQIGEKDRNRPDAGVVRILLEDYSPLHEKVIDQKGLMPALCSRGHIVPNITFESHIDRPHLRIVVKDDKAGTPIYIDKEIATEFVVNLITFINSKKGI